MHILLLLCMVVSQGKQDGPDLRCGSYSLYIGLKSLDLPLESFEDLDKRLGQPTDLGYSIGRLAEAAEAYGAHTLGVETTVRNLRRRQGRFACIALLEKAHFVNVVSIEGSQVHIIDAPREFTLPLDTFRARWSGKALLVSAEQLTPEEAVGTGIGARIEDFAAALNFWKVTLILVTVVGLIAGGIIATRRLSSPQA